MTEVKAHCVVDSKTGLFHLTLQPVNDTALKVTLTYDQYFALVKYLGNVAISYQKSLQTPAKQQRRKTR